MSAWIADVHCAAFNLRAIAPDSVSDADVITVLTGGLPASYAPFVVTLDSTPESLFTLEYVITRLLNEEARQSCTITPTASAASGNPNDAAYRASTTQKPKNATPIERITCYRCQGKGHYARNCIAPAPSSAPPRVDNANAATTQAPARPRDEAW